MISLENKIKNRIKKIESYNKQFAGKKYGMLTIIEFTGYNDKNATIICKAKCDCGKEKDIIFISLTSGNTTSCGCKMFTDMAVLIKEKEAEYVGKKFGTLTVLKVIGYAEKGWDIICQVKCDCGIIKEMSLYRLIKGAKSCGCKTKELISIAFTKHGLKSHPLYMIWAGIKQRCYNEDRVNYRLYGKIGVRMCDEWINDFEAFYNWCMANGWEKGLHVDKDIKARKLGKIGLLYSPEWCSIVTGKENSNNKKNNRVLNINGVSINLYEASVKYNIPGSTLFNRLKRGWSDEKALLTPIMKQFASH